MSFLAALACALPAFGCSILVDLDGLASNDTGGGGTAGLGGGAGAGGTPEGELVSFTDDEQGEFDQGTYDQTQWTGESLALAQNADSGEFESRRFDAESPGTVWETLAWQPLAPYGKPLPGGGDVEDGYAEGGISMQGNELLLHFDGTGAITPGRVFEDASGEGHDAIAETLDGSSFGFAPGRFAEGLGDNTSSYAYVDLGANPTLQFGVEDFTWALWVKTTEPCTGNKVHLGVEDVGADRAHLWLGCGESSEWSSCPSGAAGGRAAGTFRSQHALADGGNFCGTSRINDGRWHHVAIMKSGHPDADLRLFVDGSLEYETAVTFATSLDFFDAPQLAIGAFSAGTYQASGVFDEVAIWRRSLTYQEIAGLHRRGALRLSFQVRTCSLADCTEFTGPGLAPDAWFSDPASALDPGASLALEGLPAAHVLQYKARFESDVIGLGPALREVTVTARR